VTATGAAFDFDAVDFDAGDFEAGDFDDGDFGADFAACFDRGFGGGVPEPFAI
jgi:hypothetical protein